MKAASKGWRNKLGCGSQGSAKNFLSGKDIRPKIDHAFIARLSKRCVAIFSKLNDAIHPGTKNKNFDLFTDKWINETVRRLTANGLIEKLNNHGRRPERMAFDWLRGYATLMFFIPTIERLFGVKKGDIAFAGRDHELDATSFSKSPLADVTINRDLKVEIQAGFSGINDLKESKIVEAYMQNKDRSKKTVLIHFDFFNGLAAVVDISRIGGRPHKYIQRPAMEGKKVLVIPGKWFSWDLSKPIPATTLRLCRRAAGRGKKGINQLEKKPAL